MTRRGRGEGTITQRADGSWCAAVDLGWRGGKRARKWLYGKTRAEVAAKLVTALADLQKGIAPADQRVTVSAWLTRHLDDLEANNGVKRPTIVRYRGILRNYIDPGIGHRRLGQLQPQHILAYQSELLRLGFSKSTIVLHRALLSRAINEAVAFGIVPRNVVALVKPPKDKEDADPKGKALPADHARALLEATRNDPLSVFYLLLLTAGLRRGEALGLTWQDITLPQVEGRPAVLHIRRQLQWPNGVAERVPLKSKYSVRRIPIPRVTAQALADQRVCQRATFAALEKPWHTTELVLTTPEGNSVHRNTIVKQFHVHLKKAALPYYRPHDLRHTYGSLLMSQGVPLKTISELMGHASVEVTADVYLHSVEGQVLDTAYAVTRALALPSVTTVDPVCPTCGKPR